MTEKKKEKSMGQRVILEHLLSHGSRRIKLSGEVEGKALDWGDGEKKPEDLGGHHNAIDDATGNPLPERR